MPEHRRFVFLGAVFTGLRRGEMNRVEWRDIDLKEGTLRVRAEVDKEDKEVRVPIHPALAEALQQRRDKARPTDLVFKPVPMMHTIRRDLAKAGIDYKDADGLQLDFHALRSTFATRLLRSGIPTSVAIRFTRHASVRTLEQHYDKLGLSDAMDALPKLPDIGGL